MGNISTHEFPVAHNKASGSCPNALGLSPQEVADVKRIHAILARDASSHCVNAHIKNHPKHLERFCGRPEQAEYLHYAPFELAADPAFTYKALIHGLSQLQAFRCSCNGDPGLIARLAKGLAQAHVGIGLTSETFRDYRDVLLSYLCEVFPHVMTPAATKSWATFIDTLGEAIYDALVELERKSVSKRPTATDSWLKDLPHTSTWLRQDFPVLRSNSSGIIKMYKNNLPLRGSELTCNTCEENDYDWKEEKRCGADWDNPIRRSRSRILGGELSDTFPSLPEDVELESDENGSFFSEPSLPTGASATAFGVPVKRLK